MNKVIPVIMAGGSGTRLWPLSRKSYPKQFSAFIDDKTLFQHCALRLSSSKLVNFEKHITLTNSDFRFTVSDQLQGVGFDPGPIILEPEGKNTAPAILAASMYAMREATDPILLVAPSDHLISDKEKFHQAINLGLTQLEDGFIVIFGINPTRAETGYGYIEIEAIPSNEPVRVKRFVEKPDVIEAKKMFDKGNHLWNSGIFLFRVKNMIDLFERHYQNLIQPVRSSIDNGRSDLGFYRLNSDYWDKCDNISIDYAVMEKTDNLMAVPYHSAWSDVGNWHAVWEEMGPDKDGVVKSINAHSIDCENSLLRSENGVQVVGLGLNKIVVISNSDAVLVAHMDKIQKVNEVVNILKTQGVPQAELFPKDHRPWGWFESLTISDRFQVKRIFVNPGAALSLQSHHHRSEHWIVVEGTAKVTIDDEVKLVTEGESVHIGLGSVHRMENPGKLPLVIIEVQTGSYLGEDDIIRYEDRYSRDII